MDSLDTTMAPDTAFSYGCRRCGQCCRDKRIQINPYETARLQRRLGVTTAEFRASYTADGAGVALAQKDDGFCIFFGDAGCTVHSDRPLVCRLFPLGRVINAKGEVRIVKGEFDPPARGDFGTDGTIDAFFDGQGAGPFIAAADAYFSWYVRAVDATPADDAGDYGDLSDMDGVLAAHARIANAPEPDDIAARTTLHLNLLNRFIQGDHHDQSL